MAIIDLMRIVAISLLGMLLKPQRLPARSWRSELLCRIARRLLHESTKHPVTWTRQRQNLMKLRIPAMRRVTFKSVNVAGVPCQWCQSKQLTNTEASVVLYFHGGGYVIGSVDGYQSTLANLALSAECSVLGVDYRLAPECQLPAAQQDCLAVTRAILADYPDRRITLAGDSAGGGLCLSTLLALRGEDRSADAAVLISPWVEPAIEPGHRQGVDGERDTAQSGAVDSSMLNNGETDILSLSLTRHWFAIALGDGSDEVLSQVNFANAELTGLPPLYVQAAGAEVLVDQIERFVGRAKEQQVDVQYQRFDDQFHVFQVFAPVIPEARTAMQKMGHYITTITAEK